MIGTAVLLFLTTPAVFSATAELPYNINCEQQDVCTKDLIPWCLKGQKEPVLGHCELQKAVCSGAVVDFHHECFLPYAINCGQPRKCVMDLRPWCLQGQETPVLGHCELQDAICDQNATVDFTESCLN